MAKKVATADTTAPAAKKAATKKKATEKVVENTEEVQDIVIGEPIEGYDENGQAVVAVDGVYEAPDCNVDIVVEGGVVENIAEKTQDMDVEDDVDVPVEDKPVDEESTVDETEYKGEPAVEDTKPSEDDTKEPIDEGSAEDNTEETVEDTPEVDFKAVALSSLRNIKNPDDAFIQQVCNILNITRVKKATKKTCARTKRSWSLDNIFKW